MIEFMLGNTAAIITYPVSVIGNYYAYYLWKQKSEVVPIGINKWFFIYFLFGFFISIVLNVDKNYSIDLYFEDELELENFAIDILKKRFKDKSAHQKSELLREILTNK